jgi:hypothetical protein
MIDDKGNVWSEPNYDGYGNFEGKDYYELLAEMNGLGSDRMLGIELAFSGKDVKFPNLVEDHVGWKYDPKGPESCPLQGFFYGSDDDENDSDWDDHSDDDI